MPFDFPPSAPWRTDGQLRRLSLLIEALNRPMPDDFEWRFEVVYGATCDDTMRHWKRCGCAKGLALHLGIVDSWPDLETFVDPLGLTDDQHRAVFYNRSPGGGWGPYGVCGVQPQMVAAKLQQILDEKIAQQSAGLAPCA